MENSMTIDFTHYLTQIETALKAGNATEHTHRPALKALIESFGAGITAANEPTAIACRPLAAVKTLNPFSVALWATEFKKLFIVIHQQDIDFICFHISPLNNSNNGKLKKKAVDPLTMPEKNKGSNHFWRLKSRPFPQWPPLPNIPEAATDNTTISRKAMTAKSQFF